MEHWVSQANVVNDLRVKHAIKVYHEQKCFSATIKNEPDAAAHRDKIPSAFRSP